MRSQYPRLGRCSRSLVLGSRIRPHHRRYVLLPQLAHALAHLVAGAAGVHHHVGAGLVAGRAGAAGVLAAGLGVELGAALQLAPSTFGSLCFTNLPLFVAITSGTTNLQVVRKANLKID